MTKNIESISLPVNPVSCVPSIPEKCAPNYRRSMNWRSTARSAGAAFPTVVSSAAKHVRPTGSRQHHGGGRNCSIQSNERARLLSSWCVPTHRTNGSWSGDSRGGGADSSALPYLESMDVERQRTEAYLKRSNTNTHNLFQVLQDEILVAASNNEAAINACSASLGPTGRYLYQWVAPVPPNNTTASGSNMRIYQRQVTNGPLEECEFVLEHDWLTDRLLDMSLSIDEEAVVYLVLRNISTTQAMLRIIATGQHIELVVELQNLVSIEFGPIQNGSHSLFLVQADVLGRPHAVYSGLLSLASLSAGTDPCYALAMTCIYQSKDPTEYVDIYRTKGLDFVAINSRTQSTNEIYLVQQKQLHLIRQREHGVMYHADVGSNNDVFLLTDRQSCDTNPSDNEMALSRTHTDNLPLAHSWGHFVCNTLPTDTVRYALTDFDIFHDAIVLYERSKVDGSHRICVTPRHSELSDSAHVGRLVLPLPDDVAMLSPAGNMFYQSTSLHCYVESPLISSRALQYDMKAGSSGETTGMEPFIDSNHVQKRLLIPSRDGAMMPLSLFYKADCVTNLAPNAPLRVLLMGYGAYGAPVSLSYDPAMQPLLDRGCVLAFAHTRGGGELGRAWHHQGRGRNKPCAVQDYLASAEFLVSDESHRDLFWNRSAPIQLVARGRSAGGILIGAAVNQQPHLFDKVVLSCAFLDLDATMHQPSLHLTQHEWEEYGNPLVDDAAACTIASICPVLNVPVGSEQSDNKPQFLLIAALDDRSVPADNTLLYGKKLRERFGAEVFFHIEHEGGHDLGLNRTGVAATEVAFILLDASK